MEEQKAQSIFSKEEIDRMIAEEQERKKHETRRCGDCFWFCKGCMDPSRGLCGRTRWDFECSVTTKACVHFECKYGGGNEN